MSNKQRLESLKRSSRGATRRRGRALLVAEHKKVERPLRENEERFRELADLLPQIVFKIQANGKIEFLNREGLRCLGYTQEELQKGLNAFQMFSPADVERARRRARDVMHGQTSEDLRQSMERTWRMMSGESPESLKSAMERAGREFTLLRKDGSMFPAIFHSYPIVRNGLSAGLVGIGVDITERKRTGEQLLKMKHLSTIAETAAMVGHDLRNPLQAMTGTLYAVRRLVASEKDEDRKQAAGLLCTLDDQVEYMDRIVSDLQDYARPVRVDRVETNLPDLVKATVSNVKIPENVEVAVNVEDGLSNVRLDPLLFRRVLTNLILNAVQAMPNGGKLTITGLKHQDSLTVRVQDTGVGIVQENLERVFNPFFTTKAQGLGLGLAVCKRLTEAQGGAITVTSQVGEGSTFNFKIPIEFENPRTV